MQRVKCCMSFFGFPPVLCNSLLFTGTCWTWRVPHLFPWRWSLRPLGGTGEEWGWPGGGIGAGQVATIELWLGWQGGEEKRRGDTLLGFPSGRRRPRCRGPPCTLA